MLYCITPCGAIVQHSLFERSAKQAHRAVLHATVPCRSEVEVNVVIMLTISPSVNHRS